MVQSPERTLLSRTSAGVIGLGQMGLQHAAILAVLTGRKVCIHDSNERLLRMAGAVAGNLCVHSDVSDLLQEKGLGAVFICTPVQTHAEVARLVVNETPGDIGLFVEKPLSTDFETARQLSAYCIENGQYGMVGFQKRFSGVYVKLKELLARDTIGTLQHYMAHSFSYDVSRKSNGWKFEPPYGGVTLDFGVHAIDLLVWLFGEPEVKSVFRRSLFSDSVEDYVHSVLQHKKIIGTLEVGWSMRDYSPNEHLIEIHGTNGTVLATDDELTVYLDEPVKGVLPQGKHRFHSSTLTPKPPYLLTYPEYVLEDQYFLRCINTHIAPRPDFSDAAIVNRVVDAIHRESLAQ